MLISMLGGDHSMILQSYYSVRTPYIPPGQDIFNSALVPEGRWSWPLRPETRTPSCCTLDFWSPATLQDFGYENFTADVDVTFATILVMHGPNVRDA